MTQIITFGETWEKAQAGIRKSDLFPQGVAEVWLLRDLMGRISLLATPEENREPLLKLAETLFQELGAHAYPPDEAILVLEPEEREELLADAIQVEETGIKVYLVDREITGRRWATISAPPGLPRFVLFGLKGGLGRSTTAAVLAIHLARQGHRVLLMDFDLESPALSSVLDSDEYPDFGIVEWLVEDLVNQGDALLERMVGRPRWSIEFAGEIMVVPAFGSQCQEHIPQLGRAYLDKFPDRLEERPEKWISRIQRLVQQLEKVTESSAVILDSRNGLHDVAAALIAGLGANVLMFAVDSEPTWNGYRILFQHWATQGVIRQIRERLYMVAALVPPPPLTPEAYLNRFRQRAWNLFNQYLYDEVPPGKEEEEWFSFAETAETAPHTPFPIYWERSLWAWTDLRSLDSEAVQSAYREFLRQFDLRLSPEVVR